LSRPPHSAPQKILVADDDSQIRGLFAKQLARAGYEVHSCSSGLDTLEALRSSRWDLLVLDLNMPGTDGFDVLKTARTEFPEVRVLVISGYMRGVLLQAAEWFGAVATLEKLLAPEQLVPTVRRILGDN
jgi:CheY-like chemotaxis protein